MPPCSVAVSACGRTEFRLVAVWAVWANCSPLFSTNIPYASHCHVLLDKWTLKRFSFIEARHCRFSSAMGRRRASAACVCRWLINVCGVDDHAHKTWVHLQSNGGTRHNLTIQHHMRAAQSQRLQNDSAHLWATARGRAACDASAAQCGTGSPGAACPGMAEAPAAQYSTSRALPHLISLHCVVHW